MRLSEDEAGRCSRRCSGQWPPSGIRRQLSSAHSLLRALPSRQAAQRTTQLSQHPHPATRALKSLHHPVLLAASSAPHTDSPASLSPAPPQPASHTMHPFTYNALPARVLFGWGTSAQVATEVQRLGCSRALVLTTPQQVDAGNKVKADLGDLAVGIYSNATMHTPMHVTQDALARAHELGADCCVRPSSSRRSSRAASTLPTSALHVHVQADEEARARRSRSAAARPSASARRSRSTRPTPPSSRTL